MNDGKTDLISYAFHPTIADLNDQGDLQVKVTSVYSFIHNVSLLEGERTLSLQGSKRRAFSQANEFTDLRIGNKGCHTCMCEIFSMFIFERFSTKSNTEFADGCCDDMVYCGASGSLVQMFIL